jgi:hypothetical protein
MNDFPRKWHPLARRIPGKNKNGGKAPPLTLEGSGYHRVVVTLLLLFSGVRCAILNTRAGMHRYLYSIFYIFFQMLSHCDNTPAPGKDRIPDLAGGGGTPAHTHYFSEGGLPPSNFSRAGSDPHPLSPFLPPCSTTGTHPDSSPPSESPVELVGSQVSDTGTVPLSRQGLIPPPPPPPKF